MIDAEEVGAGGPDDSGEDVERASTREIVAGTVPIKEAINGTTFAAVRIARTRLRMRSSLILLVGNLTSPRGIPKAGRVFSAIITASAGRRYAAQILYGSRYLVRLFIRGHFKQCQLVITQFVQYCVTLGGILFQIFSLFGAVHAQIAYKANSFYITPDERKKPC